MSERTTPRLPVAISGSQGKIKYVLEDVFWVPISNSRWRYSSSFVLAELPSDELDTGEVASAGETELGSAINLR
jgi:hypothetical protein